MLSSLRDSLQVSAAPRRSLLRPASDDPLPPMLSWLEFEPGIARPDALHGPSCIHPSGKHLQHTAGKSTMLRAGNAVGP